MRYKSFGNTGLEISSIGTGTWAMGGKGWDVSDRESCITAIRAMAEKGVNHIDTAPAYGRGLAEEIVGEAVTGIRDKLIITTKCGMNIDKPGFAVKKAGRDEIIKGCEASLKRMKLDYVDILFLHWPDENTPIGETIQAMNTLKEQGKIRFIGVSNFSNSQLDEARKYAEINAVQLPYSMVDKSAQDQLKYASDNGIATMTYGSLGAGILAGGIRRYTDFGEGDMRGTFYSFFREPEFSKVMLLLKSMDKIAEDRSVPLSQIAVNWAVQKNFVDTALIGVRKISHVEDNCQAMDWELTEEEISFLDAKAASVK